MPRIQTIQIPNSGGGLNLYDHPSNIQPSECALGTVNIRLSGAGYYPRPGYLRYGEDYNGGYAVAMGVYQRNDGSSKIIRVTSDNKIYQTSPIETPVWEEITQSVLTNPLVDVVSVRDRLFLFNGTDEPIQIVGTTVTQPFTRPDSIDTDPEFTPTFGAEFYGSLFVGGVPGSEDVLFNSKFSTAAEPELLTDFSGAADARGDADATAMNEPISSIRKANGSLVVFLQTYAVYVSPFELDTSGKPYWPRIPVEGADGALHHRVTTVVENDIFYLTPNKEIKSIRRDFSSDISIFSVPISVKIQKYIDQYVDDDLSGAFSVYDPNKKLYKLHLPKKGDVMNTVVLVADIRTMGQDGVPAWVIDEGKPFSCGVYHNTKLYTGSPSSGQCYIDEVGGADDDNVPIISRRYSKFHPAGNPKSIKTYREARLYGSMTPSSVLKVGISVDGVFIEEDYITSRHFINPVGPGGGIGSQPIGLTPIGSDISTPDPFAQRYEYQYSLPLYARGRTIQVITETNGTSQDHEVAYQEYGVVPTKGQFYPPKEK